MKLQVLMFLTTVVAVFATEFLQSEEDRNAAEDKEWERFKVTLVLFEKSSYFC